MGRCNGIYPGICVSTQDPERRSRLQVKVPAILGDTGNWARGCVWPNLTGRVALPSVGDTLWVMFEGGDSSRPVWLRYEQRVPATTNCFGVYAGICVSTEDPQDQSRVQVKVPAFTNDSTAWARNVSGATSLPSVGDTVWIMFESGDPQYPLWLGVEP